MSRRIDRRQLGFPIAVMITIVTALLPLQGRWEVLSRDLGRIASLPVVPFTHGVNLVVAFVRPAPVPGREIPDTPEATTKLLEDREAFERLYLAEREKVKQLREQLAQIQMLPEATIHAALTPIVAQIAKHSALDDNGVVVVKLPKGRSDPVPRGTIAVYAGVHLLGRVVEPTTRTTAAVLPLANESNDFVVGRLFDDSDERGDELVSVEPRGDGMFRGTVRASSAAQRGDVLRLVDESWPATAQMMILGEVVDVRVDDDEPLRHIITVRPRYDLAQLVNAVLIVDRADNVGNVGNAAP